MKITIITAVYNNRATIGDSVASVLSQTHGDIELIVIDGGSTDGTLDVLRNYADKIAVLVSEPDQGIYDALNKGIARASGEVIGFLHSDDLYADEQTIAAIAGAFADPAVDAVYGDLAYVRKENPDTMVRLWRAGHFSPEKLKRGWMAPHPTLYVRRRLYQQLGGFDARYRIAADYDWMLRLFTTGGVTLHYIPRLMVKMRVGGVSNRSLRNLVRKSSEDYRALRRNKVGGIGALVWKNLSKIPQFFRR